MVLRYDVPQRVTAARHSPPARTPASMKGATEPAVAVFPAGLRRGLHAGGRPPHLQHLRRARPRSFSPPLSAWSRESSGVIAASPVFKPREPSDTVAASPVVPAGACPAAARTASTAPRGPTSAASSALRAATRPAGLPTRAPRAEDTRPGTGARQAVPASTARGAAARLHTPAQRAGAARMQVVRRSNRSSETSGT